MRNKINFSEIFNKELTEFFKPLQKTKKKSTIKKSKVDLKIRKNYLIVAVLLFFVFGFLGGIFCLTYLPEQVSSISPQLKEYFLFWQEKQDGLLQKAPITDRPGFSDYKPQTSQEEAVIKVVKNASPSVVSIIITKDMPVYEKYYEIQPYGGFIEIEIPKYREKGTEKKKIGSGTGFIVSKQGMVLTNKHVVSDKEADYTIITSDGEKYPGMVLALDPLQDLAILKIEQVQETTQQGAVLQKSFPVLKLGDSSKLQIGQTVLTIGNALGEFRNTVSVGVISGLGRNITASSEGVIENLEDVIQTDAAINKGNSGGPLLNLKSEVIGVNVAMAEAAQSIGFSIPINKAKRDIKQVEELGKIVYPFLGIRYVLINPELQEEEDLPVDDGALIVQGEEGPGIVPDSAADRAGLKVGDIILELDGQEITQQNPLSKIIKEYMPEDRIVMRVLRDSEEMLIEAILGEITSED